MDTKTETNFYALSPLQAGMLFQSLYDTKTGVDIEQVVCSFKNADPDILRCAWEEVWQTIEVLRTGFDWQRLDQPVQRIFDGVKLPWRYLDWKNEPGDPKKKLESFLRQDRLESFFLNKPPLMRLTMIETNNDAFFLVWSFHHILLDGRAFPYVFRQMAEAYELISNDRPVLLQTLRPFKDYISWLEKQDWTEAKDYWKEQLKGVQNPTPIGIRQPASPKGDGMLDYGLLTTYLPEELVPRLKNLAKQHSVTLNTILQGAWAVLLSRYSSETDIVFGTIRTGRHSALGGEDAGEIVGLLINTLPVRVNVDPDSPVLQVIKDLRARALELRNSALHEHVSLAEIQKLGDIRSGARLFDTILAYENFELTEMFKSQHPMLASWEFEILAHVGYDLVITATDGQRFRISLEYSRVWFNEETAQRILEHLHTLLESIANDPYCSAGHLNILSKAEKEQILDEWNKTQVKYPTDICTHILFERQVEKHPESVAIVFENEALTYRTLNQRANQLAHYLQTQGVGPEIPVGICMDRSIDLLVGVLGILKAGSAYVPLNPTYPAERLAFMIQDTRTPIVLTQKTLEPLLPRNATQIICLDVGKPYIESQEITNPVSTVQPTNLAYIVYTSGSTGQAKGVMVNHVSLVNAYFGWRDAYKLEEVATVHLQMANFSFDVFSGDWTRALCSGGKLVISSQMALLDPPLLYDLMQRESVNCAEFVPAVFRNLQLYLEEQQKTLDFMRTLVVASDSWYVSESLKIQKLCGPQTQLINSYGVTECTIDSTYFDCTKLQRDQSYRQRFLANSLVPIGKPFANTRIYILDPNLQPVPIGIIGELYIGGLGVARGYLNQPELTRERFIPNIFNSDNHEDRLYKTGDLARYLPDGNIEFLGRIDQQVKIRGFRIELGEIESALEEHPEVREVVVLALDDKINQKRLIAYFTTNIDETLEPSILRDYLKEKLPEFMIPSTFLQLAQFPLSASGKINRRALPEPKLQPITKESPALAQTPLENTLIEIWTSVLDLKDIGIHDNFFDLGGHSLIATRLFARIRKTLGMELPLRILFEAPTVYELAKRIENFQWAAQQILSSQAGKGDFEEITI